VTGLVRELVISDGGSSDATLLIAEAMGARIVEGERGRGGQLRRGAEAATSPWLLFLHADTVLSPGWEREVMGFIEKGEEGRAGAFRFRLDDARPAARLIEAAVALRTRTLGLPYGDQGLLLSRRLYAEVGGFRPMPIMEDVDIVRRIGRQRLTMLRHEALSSPARYRRDGYARRVLRNALCLSLWFAGVAPERIAKIYG
jgi:rSAM/selenodomain-associated transferase 2